MRCPHAIALWQALTDEWELPAVATVVHSGSEWLLHLLHGATLTQQARILMIMWIIWYAHNEVTHSKPLPSIEGSKRFLLSYMESLTLIKQHPPADIEKGKMVVDQNLGMEKKKCSFKEQREKEKWKLPDNTGYAKLNVDGSFAANGEAGAGMVLRNDDGMVVFAACRQLFNCADALDAELAALEEGLNMALQWSNLPIVVETDCRDAIELITDSASHRSPHMVQVTAIKELLREREARVAKIGRDANGVSDALVRLGRVEHRTMVWLDNFPPDVSRVLAEDFCKNTV